MISKRTLQLSALPFFALLAIGSSSPKKEGADDKAADSKGASPASTTTVTSASKIGTPVTIGDAAWTVVEVQNRGTTMKATDEFTKDATTSGAFIQVHVRIANNGKEEGVLGQAVKLVDSTGREFGTYDNAYSFRPKNTEGLTLEKVQPSMSREFTEIFEIPAGVTEVSLKAHDFGLFAKDKKIELGKLPPAPPPPAPSAKAAAAGGAAPKAQGNAAAPPAAAKGKTAPTPAKK